MGKPLGWEKEVKQRDIYFFCTAGCRTANNEPERVNVMYMNVYSTQRRRSGSKVTVRVLWSLPW